MERGGSEWGLQAQVEHSVYGCRGRERGGEVAGGRGRICAALGRLVRVHPAPRVAFVHEKYKLRLWQHLILVQKRAYLSRGGLVSSHS